MQRGYLLPEGSNADLMQMGVFANVWQLLGFETISRIARKYGFVVKKAA